jgi:hypothetical protein
LVGLFIVYSCLSGFDSITTLLSHALVFATGMNEYKLTHKGFELAMRLLQADKTEIDLNESQNTNADSYSPIEMSSKIYSREELSQIDENELLNTPLWDLIFSPKKKDTQVFEIDSPKIHPKTEPKIEKKQTIEIVDSSMNSEIIDDDDDDVICIE